MGKSKAKMAVQGLTVFVLMFVFLYVVLSKLTSEDSPETATDV